MVEFCETQKNNLYIKLPTEMKESVSYWKSNFLAMQNSDFAQESDELPFKTYFRCCFQSPWMDVRIEELFIRLRFAEHVS